MKREDLVENLANNERDPTAPGSAEHIGRYRAALTRLDADPSSNDNRN